MRVWLSEGERERRLCRGHQIKRIWPRHQWVHETKLPIGEAPSLLSISSIMVRPRQEHLWKTQPEHKDSSGFQSPCRNQLSVVRGSEAYSHGPHGRSPLLVFASDSLNSEGLCLGNTEHEKCHWVTHRGSSHCGKVDFQFFQAAQGFTGNGLRSILGSQEEVSSNINSMPTRVAIHWLFHTLESRVGTFVKRAEHLQNFRVWFAKGSNESNPPASLFPKFPNT